MIGLLLGIPWLSLLSELFAPLMLFAVAILPLPAEGPAFYIATQYSGPIAFLVTWSVSLLGAAVSYELARVFGAPLAERVLPPTLVERARDLVGRTGWPGLLGLRLIPWVAFTAVNWGAGLLRVPRGRFLWTTALGIAPGVALFTSLGQGLGDLLFSAALRDVPVWVWASCASALLLAAPHLARQWSQRLG